MNRLHRGLAALFALSLASGGLTQSLPASVRDEPAPGVTLTPDQQARRKAYIENRMATRLALMNASEEVIRDLLAQCRSAIHARAVKDAAGTPVALIEPPASPQAARLADSADARVASLEERWNGFAPVPGRKIRRGELDLAWAVVFGDPAGGSTARVARYTCDVDRHLTVSVRSWRAAHR